VDGVCRNKDKVVHATEAEAGCPAGRYNIEGGCWTVQEVKTAGNVQFFFFNSLYLLSTEALAFAAIPLSFGFGEEQSGGPVMVGAAMDGCGTILGTLSWGLTYVPKNKQKMVLKQLGVSPPRSLYTAGMISQWTTAALGTVTFLTGLFGDLGENTGLSSTAAVFSYATAASAVASFIINTAVYGKQRRFLRDAVVRSSNAGSGVSVAPYAWLDGKKAYAGVAAMF
jgi:hypothetical protein